MDAIVKPWPKGTPSNSTTTELSEHVRAAPTPVENRPTREQAETAVRTLIAYIGDNPAREGLLDTPKGVVGAWDENSIAATRNARWRPWSDSSPRPASTTISCW